MDIFKRILSRKKSSPKASPKASSSSSSSKPFSTPTPEKIAALAAKWKSQSQSQSSWQEEADQVIASMDVDFDAVDRAHLQLILARGATQKTMPKRKSKPKAMAKAKAKADDKEKGKGKDKVIRPKRKTKVRKAEALAPTRAILRNRATSRAYHDEVKVRRDAGCSPQSAKRYGRDTLTKFSAHFDDTRGFHLKQHEGKAYNKTNCK